MSVRRLRIALAAGEAAGVQLLRRLGSGAHLLALVLAVTDPEETRGTTVAASAKSLELRVEDAALMREARLAETLRELEVDLLLNVHALHIAHPEVLRAPRIGAFNLHPGPLPTYAGLNAPSWAIYKGEREYAVTLHWMLAELDAGPIAFEARMPLRAEETGLSLSSRCVREGLPLVERLVEQAAADPAAIPRRAQANEGRRVYRRRELPEGGAIRWSQAAADIERLVRAAEYHPLPSPWGAMRARHGEADLGVVRARLTGAPCPGVEPGRVGEPHEAGGVRVASGDEWLRVALVRESGEVRRAEEVLVPGERLEDGIPRPGRAKRKTT